MNRKKYIDAELFKTFLVNLCKESPQDETLLKCATYIDLQPFANVEEKEELINQINFAIKATNLENDYSIGFKNGLRLAQSFIDGKDPKYEHLKRMRVNE